MRFVRRGLLLISLAPAAVRAQAAPVLEHFTVTVDGHPMAVWARRPPAPKGSILLIHGRTWSARPDFDLQVPGEQRSVMAAFAARGYAAYALDLRGYGATPRDRSGWLTPTRAAQDVNEVLAWIAARTPTDPKPALLGWSVGSLVVQLAAQQHPEGMSALVLYGYPKDPAEKYDPDPPTGRAPREPNLAESATADFITPGSISRKAIDAYKAAAIAADPIFAEWRAAAEFNALDPARVRVPTLVLQGEHDPGASDAALARLFRALGTRDKQRVTLLGGDHAALLEDTRPGFVAAVITFLERSKAAASRP